MKRKFKKDSSKYFQCDHCDKKFKHKKNISFHLKKCTAATPFKEKQKHNLESWRQMLACPHCKIVFGNRTLLARHIEKWHKEISAQIKGKKKMVARNNEEKLEVMKCQGCHRVFARMTAFRQHRRREHYNLQAKIPYCEQKKVNQVWFEKVLNCTNIVEIHKKAPNTLVMRKLDKNTAIKVQENNTKIIDLSDMYPISKKPKMKNE